MLGTEEVPVNQFIIHFVLLSWAYCEQSSKEFGSAAPHSLLGGGEESLLAGGMTLCGGALLCSAWEGRF